MRLAREVIKAAHALYVSTQACKRAADEEHSQKPLIGALVEASDAQNIAIAALDNHLKEHGC